MTTPSDAILIGSGQAGWVITGAGPATRPDGAWRRAPGQARALSGPAAARRPSRIDGLGGAVCGSVEAERLEALILRHCSRQIIAVVGPNAGVVDVGEEESPSTALLRAALDRSSNEGTRACRRLFVLPPGRMNRARPVDGIRLLRELGENSGPDDLLVAGAALPSPGAVLQAFDFSTGDLVDLAASYPYSVGRFANLAAQAGWQHCQLWSDGQGRYAIHVLERCCRSDRLSC